jgi:RND family efflux transporter MFP subunit
MTAKDEGRRMPFRSYALLFAASLALAELQPAVAQSSERFVVKMQEIDDLKAVFATVRTKDRIEARVRTAGTVVTLKVDEGAQVEPGQVLAVIADPKIALKIKALEAQITGLVSRAATAKADFDRAEQLRQRGVTPQARLDQLKTAFEVASNELTAARAERQVAEEQIAEGQVLAPAKGRVLKVPVTDGSVVLLGESVATIAANAFLLRLELPERHARFMRIGDPIRIGARGLAADQQAMREGRIIQVYPELQAGRVIADAEVADLGDYFIGERAVAWLPAGKRRTIVVPLSFVAQRFGLDYVRLARETAGALDVVVQLGQSAPLPGGSAGVEILAGLEPGDTLTPPGGKP